MIVVDEPTGVIAFGSFRAIANRKGLRPPTQEEIAKFFHERAYVRADPASTLVYIADGRFVVAIWHRPQDVVTAFTFRPFKRSGYPKMDDPDQVETILDGAVNGVCRIRSALEGRMPTRVRPT